MEASKYGSVVFASCNAISQKPVMQTTVLSSQISRSERFYQTVPDVSTTNVLEIDYERCAVFWKRAFWLHLSASTVLILGCLGFLALKWWGMAVLYGVLALFLAKMTRMAWLQHLLHIRERVHMAITEHGIRKDYGGHNASTSRVTIFHDFSDMSSVTIGNIPTWRACLVLTGLQNMTVRLTGRWLPFTQLGIKNGTEVEALIRQKIQAAAPIQAIAVEPIHRNTHSGSCESLTHDGHDVTINTESKEGEQSQV